MSTTELLMLPLLLALLVGFAATLTGALVALYRFLHWKALSSSQELLAHRSLNVAPRSAAPRVHRAIEHLRQCCDGLRSSHGRTLPDSLAVAAYAQAQSGAPELARLK